MNTSLYKELSINGLWNNNAALVQLLGLCPLLAVTNSVVNAIGIGVATIFVLMVSNGCVSLVRNFTTNAIRLPVFVIIIAAAVTCIELIMQAYTYDLFLILGIFLPLITTNCIILGRAEAFASKNALLPALFDGFMMGAGSCAVLVILGAMRELAGTGALFDNMQLLFGEFARNWRVVIFTDYESFLLAILPPGAFIFTGFLIALKNIIDQRKKTRELAFGTETAVGSHRVRVTGDIS